MVQNDKYEGSPDTYIVYPANSWIWSRSLKIQEIFRRIEWNGSDSSDEAKPYSRPSHPWARGRGIVEFRNERTWQNAVEMNRTEEFHAAYEAAVDKVRADFGQKHPMIVGGQEVWSKTTFPDTSPADTTRSILKPYGVWAVVAPFNSPLAIAAGMSTGALITGNTVVFKPASDTPFMGLRLAETLRDAGLPAGVFNFVTGPGATVGQELLDDPDVDGFVFTGSRAVGMKALQPFTRTRPKPIITEMGGENPAIVNTSAGLDKGAIGVMRAAFGYGGQKCSACSRVLVDQGVKDAFMAKLLSETEKIKVGDPTVRDVYLGPVINEAAVATFENAIAEIKRSKGAVIAGGRTLKGKRHFVEPAIVDGLPRDHRINKEELFVPILSIVPVDDLADAIQVANDVDYGLTAGIFSREPAEIRRFLAEVHAGGLYANRTGGGTTGAVVGVQPFGGWETVGTSGKSAGGHYYLMQFLREQSQSEYS